MAEQDEGRQSKRADKGSSKSGPKRGAGLAPVQGDYSDDRPAERKPGTREHLGSERPYEGEPAVLGESIDDARNR